MTEIQKKALNAVFEKFDGMTDEELLKRIDSQKVLDNDLFVDANRLDYKMENGFAQDSRLSSEAPFSETTIQINYNIEDGVSSESRGEPFNDFGLSSAA